LKERYTTGKDENTNYGNNDTIQPNRQKENEDTKYFYFNQQEEEEEESDSDDVNFSDSPTAWTLHRVSDGLQIASTMTSSVIKTSSDFTQAGIGIVSNTVTGILPQVVDIPLPGIIKDTAHIVSDTTTSNVGAIVGGVQFIGKSVGSIVGRSATETIEMVSMSASFDSSPTNNNNNNNNNSNNNKSNSPITKSVGRLAKVSLESFTSVTGEFATATKDVQNKVTNEAIVVVTHVAGNDVGELVKDGVKVTEEVLKLGVKLHAPFLESDSKEMFSNLAQDTTKNMGKKMVKKFALEAKNTTLEELKKSKFNGNQKLEGE
jgi:hypothetical protein